MKNLMVVLTLVALVAMVVLLVGHLQGPAATATDGGDVSAVLASAGGMTVRIDEIRGDLEHMNEQDRAQVLGSAEEFKKYVTDQLLGRIMIEEARKLGLAGDSEYNYKIRQAEQAVLYGRYIDYWREKNIVISDSEINSCYQSNIAEFRHGDLVGAIVWIGETLENVQKARALLLAGAASELVERQCMVQAKPLQVDLAKVPPAQQRLFTSLRDGEYSQPLQDQGTWAILRRVKMVPAGTAPLSEVREKIVAYLSKQRFRTEFLAYNETLKTQNPLNFNTELFAQLGVAAAAPAVPAGMPPAGVALPLPGDMPAAPR